MKPYNAISTRWATAFPAIGIVAAVLGVIKAHGKAINESPEVLGGLIGCRPGRHAARRRSCPIPIVHAAGVATSRSCATKQHRLYIIVKQTLLAYMNGSVPQVALEYGRKTISSYERPSIDAVEQEMMNPGGGNEGGLTDERRDREQGNSRPAQWTSPVLASLTGGLGDQEDDREALAPAFGRRLSPTSCRTCLEQRDSASRGRGILCRLLETGQMTDRWSPASAARSRLVATASLRDWSPSASSLACGNSPMIIIASMERMLGALQRNDRGAGGERPLSKIELDLAAMMVDSHFQRG
jgi:hypothetical protein